MIRIILCDTMQKTFLFFTIAIMAVSACSKSNEPEITPETKHNTTPLAKIDNISLDSNASSQTVTLSRDVESDEGEVLLADGSTWIKHLSLKGNTITFDVEENPNITTGHRFDTILVKISNVRVGAICVTQARTRTPLNTMEWCTTNASYYRKEMPKLSGQELTKLIYNLEKTTNGADSYKNYPAFAYCIEMNHDPDNNMEWHLPSNDEIPDVRGDNRFTDNYYWTASGLRDENYAHVYKTNSGATTRQKDKKYLVYVFRNGSDK